MDKENVTNMQNGLLFSPKEKWQCEDNQAE
jgi:hypothetical protein